MRITTSVAILAITIAHTIGQGLASASSGFSVVNLSQEGIRRLPQDREAIAERWAPLGLTSGMPTVRLCRLGCNTGPWRWHRVIMHLFGLPCAKAAIDRAADTAPPVRAEV